jgi:phosphatidylglycerol lysyltransferase
MAGRTAVVLGDLIGPREMSPALLALFVEHSRRLDRVPVVYQASQEGIAVLRQAGFRTFKVGEEAVIDLPSFDLAGPRRANLRHTVTRCKRDGVTLRWFPDGLPLAEVHLAEQLEAIDRAWRRHAGPEMGFTISRFERANLTWQPISIAVDRDGRALGFTTYRRTGVDGGWVLDLMRRAPDGPPGVIEACIAEAALAFSHAGSSSLSLGLAPLSGLDQGGGPFEERLLAHLGPLARHWYDVRGLWFFKNKFDPVWLPRYGAALRRRDFVAFAMGLMWVHVGAAVTWPRGRSRRAAAAA